MIWVSNEQMAETSGTFWNEWHFYGTE